MEAYLAHGLLIGDGIGGLGVFVARYEFVGDEAGTEGSDHDVVAVEGGDDGVDIDAGGDGGGDCGRHGDCV